MWGKIVQCGKTEVQDWELPKPFELNNFLQRPPEPGSLEAPNVACKLGWQSIHRPQLALWAARQGVLRDAFGLQN